MGKMMFNYIFINLMKAAHILHCTYYPCSSKLHSTFLAVLMRQHEAVQQVGHFHGSQ